MNDREREKEYLTYTRILHIYVHTYSHTNTHKHSQENIPKEKMRLLLKARNVTKSLTVYHVHQEMMSNTHIK